LRNMKKAKPGTKVRDQLSKLTFMLQKQESLIIGIYSLLLLTVILKLTWVAILLTPIFLFSVITKDKVQLAFYLGVFSLSFDQIFISVGFSLKIHMLVFLVVALALIYQSFKQRKFPPLLPQTIVVSLFFLLVFSITSLFPAQDKTLTVRFVASLFYAVSVFYMTFVFLRNRQQVVNTVSALIAGMVISVVVGVEQYIAYYYNLPFYGGFGIFNPGNFVRPAGLFDHPNFLANFLLVAIPLTIGYTFWIKGKTLLKKVLVSVSLVSLIITFSRAAYIGMTLFLAVVFFFTKGTKQVLAWAKYLGAVLAFTVVGLSSLFYLVGPYSLVDTLANFSRGGGGSRIFLNRVTSSADPFAETNAERLLIWRAGLSMFNDNWLLGVGLENFRVRYAEYKLPDAVLRKNVVAHNTYFQLLIETGIFGAVAFAAFWITVFFKNFKGILKATSNSFYYYLLLGGMSALLGVTFQNLTNSVLYYPHTWFLYGFILAVSALALRKR